MARIEILVEEPSMKAFLSILLPKILSDNYWTLNQNYFIRSFDGKSDLQNNIPSKIKAFRTFLFRVQKHIQPSEQTWDAENKVRYKYIYCSLNRKVSHLVIGQNLLV